MNFGKYPWQEIYDWFQENGTHNFPWRQYNIPENNRLYRVWISEIFLQQTQADRVVGYFTKIIQAFPDVKTLAKTDYDTFFPYYKGMGYYSRARNILKTAKILDEIYKEKLPKNKKQLIKLPGIGEYTARAILAFGYGEPTLAWDTNLEKIFSRYFFGTKERKLTDKEKQNIENDFKKFVVPKENPEKYVRDINNALMDFGRIVDKKTTDEIDWENYPIQSGIWYDTKGKNEIKTVKTRDIFPTPDAKIIVILHKDHTVYFSKNDKKYIPFTLPPAENRNIRAYIKDYFLKKYNLELSVRPANKKWISKNGTPYISVNSQVQTGNHTFHTFSKGEIKSDFKAFFGKIT